MNAVLAILGSAVVGSLVTLLIQHLLDRGTESRTARRDVYQELLAMLSNRRRQTERLSYVWRDETPPDLDEDRLDALDAKLQAEASPQVRVLAAQSFSVLHRFWNSLVMRAPVEVDEHNLLNYRFDQMRGKPDELQDIAMRFSLGRLHDELVESIEALAAQIRRELHGRAAGR